MPSFLPKPTILKFEYGSRGSWQFFQGAAIFVMRTLPAHVQGETNIFECQVISMS
jgi:hypothetical protein